MSPHCVRYKFHIRVFPVALPTWSSTTVMFLGQFFLFWVVCCSANGTDQTISMQITRAKTSADMLDVKTICCSLIPKLPFAWECDETSHWAHFKITRNLKRGESVMQNRIICVHKNRRTKWHADCQDHLLLIMPKLPFVWECDETSHWARFKITVGFSSGACQWCKIA